jgi:RNA polymerase sigma-70 factor (ECF subfamily)
MHTPITAIVREPEAELVDQARTGDHLAFAQLVRDHDTRLRALAHGLLPDRSGTDDVLQEVYLKAWRNLDRFRGDARLGTWLYRITYNACLDELRRGSRREVVALDDEAPGPVTGSDDGLGDDLTDALGGLTPDLRAAVLMVDVYGYEYSDAAKALGVPTGTIASRLNRARARLRRDLRPVPAAA